MNVEELIQTLVCGWCGSVRDVCPCSPRPLPEPRRSATVRTLQRGAIAESRSEPLDVPPEPGTRGAGVDTLTEPLRHPDGPVCGLFPPKRGAA